MGAGTSLQFGLLDETPGFIDPGRVENDAGAQKEQPRRARGVGCCLKPRPAPARGYQHAAAGAVRDRGSCVARARVGDDHFAHDAGGRA